METPTRTVRQKHAGAIGLQQRAYFDGLFGAARYVFNQFIEEREIFWQANAWETLPEARDELTMSATKSRVSAFKNLRPDQVWLKQYPSWTLQQAAIEARDSYYKWWDKNSSQGKPRFKKRGVSKESFKVNKPSGKSYRLEKLTANKARVYCGKHIGWVQFKINKGQELPYNASGLTILKTTTGKIELSFVVKQVIKPQQWDPNTNSIEDLKKIVGVDLGLIDLLTIVCSDGSRDKVPNPRHSRKHQRKLRKAQKKLARCWGPANPEWRIAKKENKDVEVSENYKKQRLVVAECYEKVRNDRSDLHKKLASGLTSENQVVCAESLSVKNMIKNRKLSRSISDAGWGDLVCHIESSAVRNGCSVIRVDRWAPTSRTCCVCGVYREEKLDLKVRAWQCGDCGTLLDRDFNAAVNIILAAGMAESLNACGDDVRRVLAEANNAIISEARSRGELLSSNV